MEHLLALLFAVGFPALMENRVDRFLRRLRGLAGLGVVGGCLGALVGAGYAVLKPFLVGSAVGLSIAASASGWGVFGAFAGTGFGLVLTLTAGRRRLHELNFWKAAILGGAIGLSLPVVWFGGQFAWAVLSVRGIWPLAAACGVFGMLLGSGFVAVAKEVDRRDLSPSHAASPLLEVPRDT